MALLSTMAVARAQAAEPPAEIKDLVETCAACHGKDGVSVTEGVPSLAAQPDVFIQYQLVFIRDGGRTVEAMQEIAKKLTDDNIRDLGAYYAALPAPPPIASDAHVDDAAVAALIQPRHCDSCHKSDFSGQGETARLAGQRPDYLVKALSDFRAAKRRGRGMGTMMEVSVTLRDEDIRMIATYLAGKP
ncbi:Cytochrome c553 [Enhydrobacter aerosaccus]|uniref:Cytochrome c553 n=1 Tax=Enhydrobacter aerosaccus TaxID=225324 RepID=A0A1T4NV25_9HYPH|nr:c-type cytochrome [Enhydrobacter aerosaccus]SJZ83200.1 Cytochrome c553 [Enhydrobacter aerosaccus]